ncbi:class I SAM-dependent methyltransferase [Patescibacteria group bacterium]
MRNKYVGEQAKKYSEFADKDFSWVYLEKPFVKRILGNRNNSNKKVLDLGCGQGRSIDVLRGCKYLDKNITGVDISKDLLKVAQKRFPDIGFVKGDVLSVDFPDSSFDTILTVMVLHFFTPNELSKIFSKCHRWLGNNGQFVLATLHPSRFAYKDLDVYFKENQRTDKTPWGTTLDYVHKTFSTYINTLIKSGFKIKELEEPHVRRKVNEKYSKPTRFCILATKTS